MCFDCPNKVLRLSVKTMYVCIIVFTVLRTQVDQQHQIVLDLRREEFVTQGAFMAAQLCKADAGVLKSQDGKLGRLCDLLVAADVLDRDAAGGLCIRKSEIKESRGEQVGGINSGKQLILDKSIERVEEVVESATTAVAEAKRAAKSVGSLWQQVDSSWTKAAKSCSGLEEEMEKHKQRIETNSTRIFHLAAEVEQVAARKCCADRVSLTSGEEPAFEVEIADLSTQKQALTNTPGVELEVPQIDTKVQEDDSNEVTDGVRFGTVLKTTVKIEPHPGGLDAPEFLDIPNHPGVFDDVPGHEDPPDPPCMHDVLSAESSEGAARIAYFTTHRKEVESPTERRRPDYIGRRVIPGKNGAQVVEPVRPHVSRPNAEHASPNSWTRVYQPPLTAPETTGHIIEAARGTAGTDLGTTLIRDRSMRDFTRPASHEGTRRRTSTNISLGNAVGSEGNTIIRCDINTTNHAENTFGTGTSRSRHNKLQCFKSTYFDTINDGEVAAGASIQKGESERTALGATAADNRGTLLARIEGAPTLWCPRDTWDVPGKSPTVESR